MVINPRKAKLLNELPKHNWKVAPAAREAGYSAKYANKNPKRILKSALRAQAQEMLDLGANDSNVSTIELKKALAEVIGMSREDVFKRLQSIAFQDKDLSSALKVLLPLAKDLGVNLGTDDNKVIVPVLNIGVRSVDESTIHGSIEPPNSPTSE